MNVLQFWLIDSIVKAQAPLSVSTDDPSGRGSSDREPLFQADDSDGEDETVDELESTPKYDVENPEPLAGATMTSTTHPRSLTPDSRTFPSGSSTPFHGDVNAGDVAMKKVHSPSPPPARRPAAVNSSASTTGDEWAWDDAGEAWGDTKRSLDALRPHHD